MTTFIKNLRQSKNISQEFIASKIGVSRPTYLQIENGARDITVVEAQKLAQFFGISLEDFLAEKTTKTPTIRLEKEEKSEPKTAERISVPQKNVKKFKEVLLYLLEKIGAMPNVGEAVICKILYFIDFDYYEKYEEQLIGAVYIKNHHGPTPAAFTKIIEEMEQKGDLVKVSQKYFQFQQRKYLPRRKANLSILSAQEKELIDYEIVRFKDKNAKEMEIISHRDIPWIGAKDLKPIDYESVFYRTPEFSMRDYDQDNL
jgi:transcriptional regulator with XRE-family HTH domain